MKDLDYYYKRQEAARVRLYKEGKPLTYCKYRPKGGVYCIIKNSCGVCGWNPKVEEQRKAQIRARINAESGVS